MFFLIFTFILLNIKKFEIFKLANSFLSNTFGLLWFNPDFVTKIKLWLFNSFVELNSFQKNFDLNFILLFDSFGLLSLLTIFLLLFYNMLFYSFKYYSIKVLFSY